MHKIPGPIHIDSHNPRLNTQSVESSHSGVKMRLRLGRGLRRHNLQPVMDFEDFVFNRTERAEQRFVADFQREFNMDPMEKIERQMELHLEHVRT